MKKKIKTTVVTEYEKVWDKQTGELLEKYPIIEKTYSKDELCQLVLDILNCLNENQENIDSDSDLLQYIRKYIE